ncbi:hypothetical protein D3C81_1664730 [compost metagenome]
MLVLEHTLDSLGHQMGAAVPEHLHTFLGVAGNNGHFRILIQSGCQIHNLAVHRSGQGVLLQAGADGFGHTLNCGALGIFPYRPVGQSYFNVVNAGCIRHVLVPLFEKVDNIQKNAHHP